jgi:thiol-disulfide isomerase/thioredoxin
LLQEFPNGVAVEKLAAMLGELDAAGKIQASAQLVDTIQQSSATIQIAPFQQSNIDSLIANHQRRFALIGAPLRLPDIMDASANRLPTETFEGKVVLVDFWASWCINCIEEIKNIESIYADHNNDGFEVVGICMDENLSDGQGFVDNRKLPWLQGYPIQTQRAFESTIAKEFGVDRIPFTLLVGRDGTVRKINSRGDALRRDVEALLQ